MSVLRCLSNKELHYISYDQENEEFIPTSDRGKKCSFWEVIHAVEAERNGSLGMNHDLSVLVSNLTRIIERKQSSLFRICSIFRAIISPCVNWLYGAGFESTVHKADRLLHELSQEHEMFSAILVKLPQKPSGESSTNINLTLKELQKPFDTKTSVQYVFIADNRLGFKTVKKSVWKKDQSKPDVTLPKVKEFLLSVTHSLVEKINPVNNCDLDIYNPYQMRNKLRKALQNLDQCQESYRLTSEDWYSQVKEVVESEELTPLIHNHLKRAVRGEKKGSHLDQEFYNIITRVIKDHPDEELMLAKKVLQNKTPLFQASIPELLDEYASIERQKFIGYPGGLVDLLRKIAQDEKHFQDYLISMDKAFAMQ